MTDEEKYTTLDTEQCKWWVNNLFGMAKEKACNGHNFNDGEEIQSAQDKIIKILEIVEEFERAQIITGGRLNGRTYAYKCGLEDGKRKTLEQQSNDCKIFGHKENCFGGATENECEHCDYKMQTAEQQPYEDEVQKVVDYLLNPKSNHTSDDCVSRQAVLDLAVDYGTNSATFLIPVCSVKNLPPVTPTHGTCKDCTNYVKGALDEDICLRGHELIHEDFYCADYKKRGNENEVN